LRYVVCIVCTLQDVV